MGLLIAKNWSYGWLQGAMRVLESVRTVFIYYWHRKPWSGRRGGGQRAGISASLSRAAAALLRWGRCAGGGGLPGAGVRAASSGSQAEQLDSLVKDKVVVFLKGTPEQPQCGFSKAVVQILRLHGVLDYAAYNVLDDPELRQGIKDYSKWPTIPQVYLNGEFVGGCDILLQMHQNGDLVEELRKLRIRSALIDEKNQDSQVRVPVLAGTVPFPSSGRKSLTVWWCPVAVPPALGLLACSRAGAFTLVFGSESPLVNLEPLHCKSMA
ncbi:glutaredoxin-related protein 5, mitochondrial-like [Apodemus sylvaticus]|uniref:glutaredoxin-related protein 5, mitochondrial-like n=1 Tax=Apodemus sylvaticus TaxID=10129 RepID=UPI00224470B6|nr:glutaredoxin-related protein 5, mitochondrial-like [Apodemus sylvaticus]